MAPLSDWRFVKMEAISLTKKLCFVVSPIGDPGSPDRAHADWLLKGIILPVFDQNFSDFKVERADKITVPGMISSQVINRLHDAELVIADMTTHNANAFYEMAIRHMVREPIIHMIRSDQKIPFDVAPHRAIPYSYSHPDGIEAAKIDLKSAVEEAIRPEFRADNPVTHARGFEKLQEKASGDEKIVLNMLSDISERMSRVEGELLGTSVPVGASKAVLEILLRPGLNDGAVREMQELIRWEVEPHGTVVADKGLFQVSVPINFEGTLHKAIQALKKRHPRAIENSSIMRIVAPPR